MVTARELRAVLELLLERKKQEGRIKQWKIQIADRYFTEHSDYGVRIIIDEKVYLEVWEVEKGNDMAKLRKTTFLKIFDQLIVLGEYSFLSDKKELTPRY